MNYMDLSKKELIEQIKIVNEKNADLTHQIEILKVDKQRLKTSLGKTENELLDLKSRIVRLTDKLSENVRTILKIINPVLERNLDDDQFIPDNLSFRLIKTMYEDYKKYFLNIHEENI